eukprot:2417935-Ditylum_brightwellii.AAC.1
MWLQEQQCRSVLQKEHTQESKNLNKLLQRLELPIKASDFLMITRHGSFLFNLSTKTSDEDYAAIYITSLPLLLSYSPPPGFHSASVVSPLGFAANKYGEVEYDSKEIG